MIGIAESIETKPTWSYFLSICFSVTSDSMLFRVGCFAPRLILFIPIMSNKKNYRVLGMLYSKFPIRLSWIAIEMDHPPMTLVENDDSGEGSLLRNRVMTVMFHISKSSFAPCLWWPYEHVNLPRIFLCQPPCSPTATMVVAGTTSGISYKKTNSSVYSLNLNVNH